MNKLALALAAGSLALFATENPAYALGKGGTEIVMDESAEAVRIANNMAVAARNDMALTFGDTYIKPNDYVWADNKDDASLGQTHVLVSLSDQMAYIYRGDTLIGAASVSSGKIGHESPTGYFKVYRRAAEYYSRTYDNAPMPYMQMIDKYGVALHAGYNPGKPASHGCIRLPKAFAKQLFSITDFGTEVRIAA